MRDFHEPSRYIKDGKEIISTHQHNIWPTVEIPELEPAFKNMGKLTYNIGKQLSYHIEKMVQKLVPTYKTGQVQDIL